jgi:hypothetical protein
VISLYEFEPAMPLGGLSDSLERAIHLVRGQKVMLDSDLAEIYGVTTKRLIEQLKRNPRRFPGDFAFQLDAEEFAYLRSQIATSKGRGGRRYLPWVFTEHGALMLASVLSSEIAIEASVRVVRAFVRLRELMFANRELAILFQQLESRMDKQDRTIARLFDTLRRMSEPEEPPPNREMGFHVREEPPAYGTNRKISK